LKINKKYGTVLLIFFIQSNSFVAMKKICIIFFLFISNVGLSQKLEFDFLASSLDESILKDYQYIKPHFLGDQVARKIKLIDLAYKWEDPPTAMRSTPLIKIEKQPIYFALRKVISPRYYKNKIKAKSMTKDQAIEQIIQVLDIALMIRYQDTESLEGMLRGIDNGDNVVEIFKDKIDLIYF
tara:strand:- start:448 stop:993 length:546 start_codon:yes stop_codon:yes gene_type:complete